VPNISVDLAYFDPPYGSNNEKMPPSRVRYASYYHLWTTVCLFDRPQLFGKAKRRSDTSDIVSASVFEEFRRDADGRFIAVKSIEQLIQATKARWIILSYSSGGRATADELNAVMVRNGCLLEVIELDYKTNVMAGMKWTNEWLRDAEKPNREFLFLLEKKST
jgi:adenine-specific DNA-methyltransferase